MDISIMSRLLSEFQVDCWGVWWIGKTKNLTRQNFGKIFRTTASTQKFDFRHYTHYWTLKCLQYFYIPVFKVEIYPKEVLSFLIDILEKIISWTEILFKKTISIWKRRTFAVSFIKFKQYNIPECNLVSTFSMVTVLFMAFTNFKMFFQGTFSNYLCL